MHATAQRKPRTATQQADITVRSLANLPQDVVQRIVNTICSDEYVNAALKTDQRRPGFIAHPCVDYLGAFVDDKLVGVFALVEASDIETDLHAMLMREAIPHSRELGRACIEYALSIPGVRRLTAYVSSARPSVINYCMRLGFIHEGTRREAETRGGFLFDVHVLGMTRADCIGG